MTITDIKQQVKQKNRFSVFVDGKYSFSLAQLQLQNSGLKIGAQLKKSDINKWKDESDFGKLLDKTLRWLAIRPRSEWELQDYLKRKQIEQDLAFKITEQIKKFGYLDDHKFAAAWVTSRRALKATSVRRLRQELLQKRVDPEIITRVLELDETDEIEVLIYLIGKKSKQSRYHDPDKLIAYLARQGFAYSDIKLALETAAETS